MTPRPPRRAAAPRPPRTSRRSAVRPLPRPLGAHQSIAGGFIRAVERAVETGCDCLQVFTRNINRWETKPIDPEDATAFRDAVRTAGLRFVVAHDSYLINPAAADPALRARSIAALAEELERAEMLGIPWVVAHPGAAGEQPPATAVRRAAEGIARALRRTDPLAAGILIETTAGQGSCLGASFEEIGAMLDVIDAEPGLAGRVGVCLDTCHVFAAGYPLFPAEALETTLAAFDAAIGLERLKLIHANDSKRELGTRVDRHEAIGRGCIGEPAFALIVRHPLLTHVPLVLETPKEGADGRPSPDEDRRNLAVLRRLHGTSRGATRPRTARPGSRRRPGR